MKMNMFRVFFAAISLLAATAHASSYIGSSFSFATLDEEGYSNVHPKLVSFHFGSLVNESLSLEGRVGTGFIDGDGDGYSVEVERVVSLFTSPRYSVGEVTLYGLIGLTEGYTTATADGTGNTASSYLFAYSYGTGISYQPDTVDFALRAEWLTYFWSPSVNATGFSVGISKEF